MTNRQIKRAPANGLVCCDAVAWKMRISRCMGRAHSHDVKCGDVAPGCVVTELESNLLVLDLRGSQATRGSKTPKALNHCSRAVEAVNV